MAERIFLKGECGGGIPHTLRLNFQSSSENGTKNNEFYFLGD